MIEISQSNTTTKYKIIEKKVLTDYLPFSNLIKLNLYEVMVQ